uniref:Uncharacterized protein n=1 Tax=Vibrio parahaemolyticus TaxID=670 RepID=Q0GIK0_VIBPH|nr:hypothetical protein [Vibrio parahaemolyticus]
MRQQWLPLVVTSVWVCCHDLCPKACQLCLGSLDYLSARSLVQNLVLP